MIAKVTYICSICGKEEEDIIYRLPNPDDGDHMLPLPEGWSPYKLDDEYESYQGPSSLVVCGTCCERLNPPRRERAF